MVSLLKKLIGSRNDRLLKQYRKQVAQINALEPTIQGLSDEALAAKTQELRQRVQDGASLNSLLPEAFAVVREAGVRVFGMRHFDVQMLGAIALHNGKISEMRTGEGKTLTATLAVYLNALSGKGVHVVTVNDYLARRDANWMGRLYNFLGLSVGVVVPQQDNAEKIAAYQADITYGTNNEFGFDYLRDNMEYRAEDPLFGVPQELAVHASIATAMATIIPSWVSFNSRIWDSSKGPMSEIVARTGWPCSPKISQKVTGFAPQAGSGRPSFCRRSCNLGLGWAACEIPLKSPLASARKTGVPRREKASASTCKVTVFPVPVAPVIQPCRLASAGNR